ncbi:MAG: hypothetical protein ACRCZH_00285 [Cetobacterium sp.]
MRVKDLKNGQFLVELKGLPPFYTTSYQDALEIAFKMGGRA